mmetsp:Transcript_7629/g.11664  ORF Transcript_7629/g.11664 Transcript_7629/m.11664 type:complete len:192 (+) Transcript_7629:93-668(+)|eukprot:CAMPEP_0178937402 /NCGR_PEP_ID=MMETSP0786-20121207/25739_1 /TAXON_ID=186022 /ORGANISM="Thalassionema frauenfeldii, Strain CCMP 1798" /LENGTH=191 /DNA_ID=CAMNT_0020615973 /DNA_START=33 /DNA_END=608 /DNA_ORIENTATION=+
MGRSQVAFNQRHGSSGQRGGKGRGRGGSASKHIPKQQTLGDNSWRFNTQSGGDQEQELEERVLALESHGNYSNQTKDESSNEESFIEISLNMQALKDCLDTLPLCDLLQLSPHLTEFLESPRPSLQSLQNEGGTPTSAKSGRKQFPASKEEDGRIDVVHDDLGKNEGLSKGTDDHDEDDDDMESWLDSVIS